MDTKIGTRFGRLRVQSTEVRRGKRLFLLCLCDCGSLKVICKENLVSGRTVSCGCFRSEISRTHCLAMATHGEAVHKHETAEYRAWTGMRRRCNDPGNARFKDYGGRGIKVCPAWDSYQCFLADMGRKPSPRHTLERKDNDLGYSKENCVWALPMDQCNNRRNNRTLTLEGQTRTATEWARHLGWSDNVIFKRLNAGWSERDTLTVTPRSK